MRIPHFLTAALVTFVLATATPAPAQDEPAATGESPAAASDEGGFALPDLPDLGGLDDGESAPAASPGSGADGYTAWEIIQFGGIVGYVIIALSFVTLSLVIEYSITIRRGRLMPKKLVREVGKLLDTAQFDEAEERVENQKSFIGYVLARGLRERDRGYEPMVKAMEDAADEAVGARLRRVEHLNIIGNLAPMLGLLGTVLGMTSSFNQISQTVGGVDPRLLAGGIFQALVTTVMGLVVAIPALYFHSLFRNRVDALISEATLTAEHMTEMFKYRVPPTPPPQAPAPADGLRES